MANWLTGWLADSHRANIDCMAFERQSYDRQMCSVRYKIDRQMEYLCSWNQVELSPLFSYRVIKQMATLQSFMPMRPFVITNKNRQITPKSNTAKWMVAWSPRRMTGRTNGHTCRQTTLLVSAKIATMPQGIHFQEGEQNSIERVFTFGFVISLQSTRQTFIVDDVWH